MGFSGGSAIKNPPAAQETQETDSVPGVGRSHGGTHVTHSSILAWKVPWTEEPVGL